MGLDTAKNISNKYVNDDFHTTMFWPEPNGGGYHYMKLEGAYNNDSTFYNTHTGGTMGGDYSFRKNNKTHSIEWVFFWWTSRSLFRNFLENSFVN